MWRQRPARARSTSPGTAGVDKAADAARLLALIERCSDAIARGLAAAGYTARGLDYEDAEQDALATIVEKYPAGEPVASPCGWMHTVARNRAIGRTRSKEAYRRNADILRRRAALHDVVHVDDYDVEPTVSVGELARLVIGALPDAYRDVVVAYHLDDKSVATIAAELGIAEDTVYTRLRRARKAMLHTLREHGHA